MNILTENEEGILNNAKQAFQDACIGKNLLMDPDSSKKLQGQASCVKTRIDSFRSPTFVVTCVGMLKSGKSTLVNLFAHNDLASPTGYGFDTTLRPALIMATPEKTGKIEIWFSNLNNHTEKFSFGKLFTYLRGVGDIESIKKDFSCREQPLTEEMLTNALCRRVHEADHNLLPTEPALVVVKVPNHEDSLLSSEIMILDTPGLDSGLSEWSKNAERYSWIISNSDLLLFLQSSVAPLNEKAADILKKMKDSQAVVWLVHNEMVTKPWLKPECIKKTTAEQRGRATEIFVRANNNQDFEQLNANLGKAASAFFDSSALLPDQDPKALLNESQFPSMKQQIKSDLLKRSAPIRRNNCKNKLQQELGILKTTVEQIQQRAKAETKRILDENGVMEDLKRKVKDWLLDPPQQQIFSVGQDFTNIVLSSSNPFKKEDFIQILRRAYTYDFSAAKFSQKDVETIIENVRTKLLEKIRSALAQMTINHFSLSLQGDTIRQNNIAKYLNQGFLDFVEKLVTTNYPQNDYREMILRLIKQICMEIPFPTLPETFNVQPDDRDVPIDVPELLPFWKRIPFRKNWTQRLAKSAYLDYFDPAQGTGQFVKYIDKIEKEIRTNLFSWFNKDFYEKMRDCLIDALEREINEKIEGKKKDVANWEKDVTTLGQMLIGCQNLENTMKEEF